MTQANNAPTTTRLSFSSAGAVRARHAAVLPTVQLAHAGLIAALAQQTPNPIVGYAADRFDIMERRDHLQPVHAAVINYTKAIVTETIEMTPLGYIADETGYLVDAASEIYAALDRAVDKMIADQAAE
jgi:hypothetical protein